MVGQLADLDKAIEIDPKNSDALAKRATVRSLISARDQNSLAPDDVVSTSAAPENDRGSLMFVFELQDAASGVSKADKRSLADLNEAIRLDPQNTAALDGRGLVYIQQGDLDKARGGFRQGDRARTKERRRLPESSRLVRHTEGICEVRAPISDRRSDSG